MIISLNWLKQFTQIDMRLDELTDVIGARLVEIEDVRGTGAKYAGAVIARIVSARPIEDSDHLNLTLIDDGGVNEVVERDHEGHVQVVCGAPNVREGMLAVWLPPGVTVPETFGDDQPFVLGARKLRGHMSNGMLASARELALFDSHDGIVEIDKTVAPGTPFAEVYALDDHLLDIENKSLTHRPDTFGIVGFAREVAAIGGKGFETPEWLLGEPAKIHPTGETYPLEAIIDDATLSRRYCAVVLSDIDKDAVTPLEIQTYLARSGVRPVNLVVDVTNYLMLLTGQPLHAFDFDKVVAYTGSDSEEAVVPTRLHVREGRDGETLALLDGRTITLTPADIVIAAGGGDDDVAIALAGAMGGADTEIGPDTKSIIIESATFDLYRLRATQMRHGVFSEAITRFTKGQPPELAMPVLAHAVTMLRELTVARVASHVVDAFEAPLVQATLAVTPARVNAVLGTSFVAADIVETLRNVEFDVEADGETVTATAPYWRTDIHIEEDLIEEIGRLNGFDMIAPVLPTRPFTAVMPDDFDRFRATLRTILSAAGANETLTYSFVHGDLLKKTGQDSAHAHALANAISPDLQYYRLSLTPSLLTAVTPNVRAGYGEFALYEIGKVHTRMESDAAEPDLPAEAHRLAFVYAADKKASAERGSAYYTAKRYCDHLLAKAHVSAHASYEPLTGDDDTAAAYEPKRAARIVIDGTVVGVIGEYRTAVAAALKLPAFTAGFELDLKALHSVSAPIGSYRPLGRYQGSDADVTFIADGTVPFAALEGAARTALDESGLRYAVTPGDIYAPDKDKGDVMRHVTLRMSLASDERTLSRGEVNAAVADVIAHVIAATGARVAD